MNPYNANLETTVIEYRGRHIKADREKICKYKYFKGLDLDQSEIDIWMFCEDSQNNQDINDIVPQLSEEEIEAIVEKYLNLEIRVANVGLPERGDGL